MQFIDLQKQYQYLKKRIDARVIGVLEHGNYIMGPEVEELEQKLADYVGVKHAISCANGTDALSLALMALQIGVNDAVFCPTFTFFATAETIALQGATPVFVDSNETTFNICPIDLEKRIKSTIQEGKFFPKAIIAVDLFGLPANYPEICRIADKYNLQLIEDAAQGFGGSISGRKAGCFGDIATTSFFPAKPLGCYGDGGALFTDNDEYAELLRSYRVHGKGMDKYDNVRVGLNSRLDTLQAAILLEKLNAFPNELVVRNNAANSYTNGISDKLVVPTVPQGYYSSWAQYTVRTEKRNEFMSHLSSNGIPSTVYYSKCMHLQTAFSYLNYRVGDFPVAESLATSVCSFPMHGYISESEIDTIIRTVRSF